MTSMVLYHSSGSRSDRVKALLDLMQVPHEVVEIDLAAETNKQPRYRAIHPLGKVPALKHGDTVIIESGAIMLYLADLYPDKNMAPPIGTPERGRYYEWFMLALATFEPAAVTSFQNPDNVDAKLNFVAMLQLIDQRLGEPYALGAQLTAVDVLLHSQLEFMSNMGRLADLPRATAYYQRLCNIMPKL